MIDYESTRAAFERRVNTQINPRMDGSGPVELAWHAWCRALDYAAQQQRTPSEHVCALHMDMTGRCSVCGAVNESIRAAQEADEARHRAEQQPDPHHEKTQAIGGGICDFCGQDAPALKVLNLAPAAGACYCKKCAPDCEADAGWPKNQTESATTPLPRPDKPGWWWKWNVKWQTWKMFYVETTGSWNKGIFVPATPPPPPNAQADR